MVVAKLQKQQVTGSLRATNSHDNDVLFAKKEELLSETRRIKLLGIVPLIIGVILTISIIGAVVGVPMIIFGLFARRAIQNNIQVADSAYEEYIQTLNAPVLQPA